MIELFFISIIMGFNIFIISTSQLVLTPGALVSVILMLTTCGIFFIDTNFIINIYILIMNIIVFLYLYIERKVTVKYYVTFDNRQKSFDINSNKLFILLIWFFSLPSLVMFYFLVNEAGGIVEYMIKLAARVDDWKGKGAMIMILKSFPIFNLLYFCFLSTNETSKRMKLLFLVHFALFIILAIGTGSRNTLLLNICLMLFFNILVGRKISRKTIFTVGFGGVALLLLLGVVRNSWFSDSDTRSTIVDNRPFVERNKTLLYSVEPLDTMLKSSNIDSGYLYSGTTYLSLLTNFVPRNFWPDKFKTGGVLFTEDYYNNKWNGYSYISPGFFVESILNFGYFGGAIIAFLFLMVNLFFLIFAYKRMISKNVINYNAIFIFIVYMYFSFSVSNVFFAEFTTNYFNFILRLIPLIFIWLSFSFLRKFVVKDNRL